MLRASKERFLDARAIAAFLATSFPAVEAICLYGSVARGDASARSDIDFLIIGDRLRPSKLKSAAASQRETINTTFLCYRRDTFEAHRQQGSLFLIHVVHEGKVLFDKCGILRALFADPFAPKLNIGREMSLQLSRLRPYLVSRRFRGNFLFPLFHVYAIAKAVAMLALAKHNVFEFNRDKVFARFVGLHPRMEKDIAKVCAFRPFYNLVTGREPQPLPFSYLDCETEFKQGVKSVQKMAAVV